MGGTGPTPSVFIQSGTTQPINNLADLQQGAVASGDIYYPYFDPQKKAYLGAQSFLIPDLHDYTNDTRSWSYNLLLMSYLVDIWMCTCGQSAFDNVTPPFQQVSGRTGTINKPPSITIGIV